MDAVNSESGNIVYWNCNHSKCQKLSYFANKNDISFQPQTNVMESKACYVAENKNFLTNFDCLMSLKQTCLNYLVANFELVDSLIGFPSILAKDLFICVVKKRPCFCDSQDAPLSIERWQHTMHIFSTAYKDELLKSINLSEKWLFLSLSIEHLVPFEYLEEIDISFCRIGNTHEILLLIGKLIYLKKLFLNNNNLTCDGVKNLTLSQRRAKTGLSRLQYLRLDGNDIKESSVMYLQSLPMLSVIVLDNKIDLSKTRCSYKFSECNLRTDHQFNIDATCKNEGWVVESLSHCIQQSEKRKERKNYYCTFYKKKKVNAKCPLYQSPTKSHCHECLVLCNNAKHYSISNKNKQQPKLLICPSNKRIALDSTVVHMYT